MKKVVSIDDIIPLIKEQINNGGDVTFTPKGNSMLPLLRNNIDEVVIRKPVGQLKKYQIALYVRKNGQYVLHRVVKVSKNGYTMRGDNQFYSEQGIEEKQIIGVVKSFTRKGKKYTADDKKHIAYCLLWVNTVHLRKILWICRKNVGKIKRKLLKKNQG